MAQQPDSCHVLSQTLSCLITLHDGDYCTNSTPSHKIKGDPSSYRGIKKMGLKDSVQYRKHPV